MIVIQTRMGRPRHHCERRNRQANRGRPIEILASSLTSGKFEPGFIDMTFEDITWRSAQEAYETAGLGPDEIDFAEVHDCFTIAEIFAY